MCDLRLCSVIDHVRRDLLMNLLGRFCTIALAGVLAGLTHSAVHGPLKLKPDAPPPLELPVPGGQAASSDAAQTAPAAVTLGLDITLEQGKMLIDAGAHVVDARAREEFEAGHIAGAFWLPANLFYEGKAQDALNFMDPTRRIVIYCGGGACDASHNTAKMLQENGYKLTHVLTDGYPAWRDAGYATENGKPFYE
jgi:rhodanese-related sulfurtransferase